MKDHAEQRWRPSSAQIALEITFLAYRPQRCSQSPRADPLGGSGSRGRRLLEWETAHATDRP